MNSCCYITSCKRVGALCTICAHCALIGIFWAVATYANPPMVSPPVESSVIAMHVVAAQSLQSAPAPEATPIGKPVDEKAIPSQVTPKEAQERPALQATKKAPKKQPTKRDISPTAKTEAPIKTPHVAAQASTTSHNTGAANASEVQAKQTLMSYLVAQIEKYKKYPNAARKLGLEGVVHIAVTIGSGGNLLSIQTRGDALHPILQKAAAETVAKVRENWKQQGHMAPLSVVIPLRYSLVER